MNAIEPLPTRISVMTLNLWKEDRMPARTRALTALMERHHPDILCVQEFWPATQRVLDAVLPHHRRVEDPFPGWRCEGTVYYDARFFTLSSYGAEEISILEQDRRLFWARLRVADDRLPELFVSTAHYTWSGNALERAGKATPRFQQAQETVRALKRLTEEGEPVLFMGDLNDQTAPVWLLRDEGGLTDCFSALSRIPRPTCPSTPTGSGVPEVIDWMFHRGPLRVRTAEVIDLFVDDVAPSDHKPILATYELYTP